jgi:hypothetical protein
MTRGRKLHGNIRDYQIRYSNWMVVVNYLKYFGDFEYVFKCFNFPSEDFNRKYTVLFNKYLQDDKLPEEKMLVSGRHRGGKPSLGFILDKKVFFLLYERFLEPNEKLPFNERVKVDNVTINSAIEEVLKEAKDDDLKYILDKNNHISVNFQYCKTGCHRFAKRHFFQNRYISCLPDDDIGDRRVLLSQSNYAIAKKYPVEGWTKEPEWYL